ncbi:glucose-6-phosphate isomerase [Marinospirillum insulare]|uniref:Glucose-6-phosphate isomerase n=1 Tax=Marinospirillum insulare TaxID=217169 RepID=A0ABQ5ZWD1_9GAMM|nr:glucose-6-phosphate isomerase [Marinospirillum insulare]GLR62971.1 glucose-6-phosphate isomerase [Marinospirillum insulare]
MSRPSNLASWYALQQEAKQMGDRHLREMSNNDQRYQELSRHFDGLLLDLSKQRIEPLTLQLLLQLAEECQLSTKINDLLTGQPINLSEKRPALHTALRLPANEELWVDGQDINLGIQASLDKMQQLVEKIHAGQWRGVTGLPVTHVVNLGVGGSDLGPLMVCHALADFKPKNISPVKIQFASTIDGSQLAESLKELNPATTLFIFSSKSFSTIDTLTNAKTARHWLVDKLGNEELVLKQHFIGVSGSTEKMTQWGIAEENQLLFWDWVGGRYSLWSAIGLPIALQIGMQGFRQLLAGAHALDQHFATSRLIDNLPVLLALSGIWNINFLNIRAQAILPYDGRLKYFPDYLTQLEMESNGKSTSLKGEAVDYATCPVLWGELGPNAQHAFYQLLHQGTEAVNCDFIAPVHRYHEIEDPEARKKFQDQHRLSLANCFAQSRLLMLGDAAVPKLESDQPMPHLLYRGNQPSSTLLIDELTPYSLGQLIALYEHKVFVQAAIWNINPFDQWGVELGKKIALATEQALLAEDQQVNPEAFDPSTSGLLKHCLTTIKQS